MSEEKRKMKVTTIILLDVMIWEIGGIFIIFLWNGWVF
jgi:hypothetical protein